METKKILALAVLMVFMTPIAFAKQGSTEGKQWGWMKTIGDWSQKVMSRFGNRNKPVPPGIQQRVNLSENCTGKMTDGCEFNEHKKLKWTHGINKSVLYNRSQTVYRGSGFTGTGNLSEFHIVNFRVMSSRQVNNQDIQELLEEGKTAEEILEYLQGLNLTYWGTMKLGLNEYGLDAVFNGNEMTGNLYESETIEVGNFNLTKSIHQETEIWRGRISLGNETYSNTFILSLPVTPMTGP